MLALVEKLFEFFHQRFEFVSELLLDGAPGIVLGAGRAVNGGARFGRGLFQRGAQHRPNNGDGTRKFGTPGRRHGGGVGSQLLDQLARRAK